MVQAALFECVSFDPFSVQQDGLAAPEVDIGGCEIAEALVVAAMIVVTDEVIGRNLHCGRNAREVIAAKPGCNIPLEARWTGQSYSLVAQCLSKPDVPHPDAS